jgi:hypothetical protein
LLMLRRLTHFIPYYLYCLATATEPSEVVVVAT